MSRPSLFGSPLFLGFDHLEQMLDRVQKTAEGYPPYNIEQTADTRLRITLAVAGFSMDDLQITQEDNQLVIRGRQKDDSEGRVFLHRGIAARQFQRAFVLAEGIEVERPAARRPAPAAVGGAGEDDQDHQPRQRRAAPGRRRHRRTGRGRRLT
jgi:HSP20 family molecular chaperone IbpA